MYGNMRILELYILYNTMISYYYIIVLCMELCTLFIYGIMYGSICGIIKLCSCAIMEIRTL